MARSRNIKPGFFTSEQLAECEPLARLLFAGLWTIADRDGRLEDRPERIKTEVLPYDVCDCDDLLRQLAKQGLIVRYAAECYNLIEIPEFLRHQRPHTKEALGKLPCQPTHKPSKELRRMPARLDSLFPDSLFPDSLFPDSLFPDSLLSESDDLNLELDTVEFGDAWSEWEQHRREIKKKLTSLAVKRQINLLTKIGHDRAIAAIYNSIAQGYTGIYEAGGKGKNEPDQIDEVKKFLENENANKT